MTAQQRADIANGVWLCQTCAKKIDNDEQRFNAALLQSWKAVAEQAAFSEIGKTSARSGAAQIVDKWINNSYAEKAGITQALTGEGYAVRWCTANDETESVDVTAGSPFSWTRQTKPRRG